MLSTRQWLGKDSLRALGQHRRTVRISSVLYRSPAIKAGDTDAESTWWQMEAGSGACWSVVRQRLEGWRQPKPHLTGPQFQVNLAQNPPALSPNPSLPPSLPPSLALALVLALSFLPLSLSRVSDMTVSVLGCPVSSDAFSGLFRLNQIPTSQTGKHPLGQKFILLI